MYEKYKFLLESKGVKTAEVSRSTGIDPATFSHWKKGKYEPKKETIQKLADYFRVPLSYFYSDGGDIVYEVSAGQGRINDGYGEPRKTFDGQTAKVVGDSMYPVLLDGDIVRFVESTDVTPSDLALVRIDGEAVTVKYVEWTDDGMWVRAENKDVFEDKFFTVKEIATIPVQIVGKAVEIVSRKL